MAEFLVIGQHYSPLAKKIKERGDHYVLLQDSSIRFSSRADPDRTLEVGFKDLGAVLELTDQYSGRADGVVSLYEQYVLPLAYIADKLALPGLSISAAQACTDKLLMRQQFSQSPEPISPAFTEVEDESSLLEFAKENGFPLILKPVHLSKSLLIARCDSEQELIDNYRHIKERLASVYSKYAAARQPKLILEQFMEGPQYSTDAFVDGAGNIAMIDNVTALQTGYDIGYDDNFTYSRRFDNKIEDALKNEILRVSALGIKALGITNSAAFIQLVLTQDGPRIIEIAARIGGYRERMYRLSKGIDMLGNVLTTALGEGVNVSPTKNQPCIALELFPQHSGTFKGITQEDRLRSLPSLNYLSVKAAAGSYVGKSSEGYKMTAVVILHNEDQDQFEKDLDFINKNVRVETD